MNRLAAICPCGHPAYEHASAEQQRAFLQSSGGHYSRQCYGNRDRGPMCKCTVSREEIAAALNEVAS